jgi:hypothetical protein
MGARDESLRNGQPLTRRVHAMKPSQGTVDDYYARRGSTYGFLERLDVEQSVDPATWHGLSLEIWLRAAPAANAPLLRLSFTGVSNLRIGRLEGLMRYIIEIHLDSNSQVEGGNYHVMESEYDLLSFLCEDFTVSEVE